MLLHDKYIRFLVNLKAVLLRFKVKFTYCILDEKFIFVMAERDKTLKEDVNLSNNNRNNSVPNIIPISSGTVNSDSHPAHHAAVSEPSTLKRKQTSFQITSVTVKGSRLSTDGGEDSADDLDESHTEDASSDILDCSRNTDVDNDQLSEDNPPANNDEAPSKCKKEISVKPKLDVPSEEPSENPQTDFVKPADLPPDQWQHRFRVVKIVSSEPFKRGRWLCLDFVDPPAPVTEAKAEIVESSVSPNIQLISSSLPESIPADKIAHIYEISPGDAFPGSISVAVGSDKVQQPMYGIFLPINNGQYPLITGMHSKAVVRPLEKELTEPEQGNQSQCSAQLTSSSIQPNPPNIAPSKTQQNVPPTMNTVSQNVSSNVQVVGMPPNMPAPLAMPSSVVQQQTTQQPAITSSVQMAEMKSGHSPIINSGMAQSQQNCAQNHMQQSGQKNVSTPPQNASSNVEVQYPSVHLQAVNNIQPNTSSVTPQPVQQQPQGGNLQSQPNQQETLPPQPVNTSIGVQQAPEKNSVAVLSQPIAENQQPGVTFQQQKPVSLNPDPKAVQQPSTSSEVPSVASRESQLQQPQPGVSHLIHSQAATTVSTKTTPEVPSMAEVSQGVPVVVETNVNPAPVIIPETKHQEVVVPSQATPNHVEAKELGTPPSTQEVVSEVPASKGDVNGEESESVPSGTSTVAIDNKIEQAMDLVKSHLMFAVREEVDVLKEKITELMDRISQLEYENNYLRANASQQTLEQLNQSQLLQQQQQQQNQPLTVSMNSIPAAAVVSQQSLPQLNIQNQQPTS